MNVTMDIWFVVALCLLFALLGVIVGAYIANWGRGYRY